MNFFEYRNGRLHAEDANLAIIADDVGTPFYCYSSAAFEANYRAFADAFPKETLIAFSVKANGNLGVLKTLARAGAGADVVSGGELKKALAAGIPASRIVFSGVGKTKAEMRAGLDAGIYQFNAESEPELEALNDVAHVRARRADITLRINPDVDARTHAKIATGASETKFGIPISRAREAYKYAASLPALRIVGVDVHIGSQITELEPFEVAFARLAELIGTLRADGREISRADLGGGLGVSYDDKPAPALKAYARIVERRMSGLNVQLILEPGRSIAADAGVLVSRVLYVKHGEAKSFLVIDAGMNDFLRPALYDAHHEIVSVSEACDDRAVYDIVGPVCETADIFARGRDMPALKAGDLVAILSAGAYGTVMASAYNARPPAPEILVKGGRWSVVRPRLSEDALVGFDRIPDWLQP